MKPWRRDAETDAFFDHVAGAPTRALLLDYDGTLAPFQADRSRAVPYAGVRERLEAVQTNPGTRLVIISGRPARSLEPLLGVRPRPEIWGSHGFERWTRDGGYEMRKLDERMLRGLDQAEAWTAQQGLAQAWERKPAGCALHWRGRDARETERVRGSATHAWSRLAEETGLELHEFDAGIELRPPGVHKGQAVGAVLEELGAQAVAAYLGDDRTDEDAFDAVAAQGWGVLVRQEARPSRARLWLRPPRELLEFLDRWIETIRSAAGPPGTQRRRPGR